MADKSDTFRLYTDLAWLWPLWGNHETEYARYCDHVIRLIRRYSLSPVVSLLDISCGGGKNIFTLKKQFRVTGLDLSSEMLRLASELNPECEFLEGDMRDFSLGRLFDSILMDDGISHMTTRAELSSAFQTAFHHLAPGGVMVVTPDVTIEGFSQNRTVVTPASRNTKSENVDVVFVENLYDPDPRDEHCEVTIICIIRERGALRIETGRCKIGLFSIDTWRQSLAKTGFAIHEEIYADDDNEYTTFACTKPK